MQVRLPTEWMEKPDTYTGHSLLVALVSISGAQVILLNKEWIYSQTWVNVNTKDWN